MDSNFDEKRKQPNYRLQQERKKRGWSQQKVANEIGTNVDTVSRWERGINIPEPFFREKLIALFGKNAKELGILEDFKEILIIDQQESSFSTDIATTFHSEVVSYNSLIKYVQRQRKRMFDAVAPGSTSLHVGDIIGLKGLFIPPPWKPLYGSAPSTDLITYLMELVTSGQRILLLGEAGQGKTTILKQIFSILADRFVNEVTAIPLLPLYIPLRDFSSLQGNISELLWSYISDDFPLSLEDFSMLLQNDRIILLLDSFDEIKGELTQRAINDHASSKLFTYPSILSCRKSFFDFYLSVSPLQECYSQCIELQPIELNNTVVDYIFSFCQKKHDKAPQQKSISPEKIVQAIQNNANLQELSRSPLLLIMMLDIFTDIKDISKEPWSIDKLYRKYSEKWLKHEAAKSHSVLRWNEKIQILEEIAWTTYSTRASDLQPYHPIQSVTFTYQSIEPTVKHFTDHYSPITRSQIIDDLCFRTLLIISEEENYYFIHKSFQDYFAARYIFNNLRSKEKDDTVIKNIEKVLEILIPFDIVMFLKHFLEEKDTFISDKNLVANNLIKVYQHFCGDDFHSVIIRQQSSHYLTLLKSNDAIQFLIQAYQVEPNKVVQRGIMVGLALYHSRSDVLEQYINLIRTDSEVASINIGYHLVYYGDQMQELGFYDKGDTRCEKTVKALFRHLKDEQYKNGWSLDLLTLSTLLETRGDTVLSSKSWEPAFIDDFLSRDHRITDIIFNQELMRLKHTLKGVKAK